MKKILFFLIILASFVFIGYTFFIQPNEEFAENDLYTEIIQRGYIKVGINPDSEPFGFYDEKGRIIGYDADLAANIAQYLVKHNSVKFIPVTPANRLIKVSTGEVDMVISTVTITPQRQEVVAFSNSYDNASQALLVKSNSSIHDIQELSDRSVGIIFGTTAEKNIQRLVPTANIQGFKSYQDAYVALKNGKVDAISSDDTILNKFTLKDKDVKLLPRRYSYEPYGIAFKKGDSTIKLQEEVNYAIKELKRRNVINSLHKKWGLG